MQAIICNYGKDMRVNCVFDSVSDGGLLINILKFMRKNPFVIFVLYI